MPRIEHKIENNVEKKHCGKCKTFKPLDNFGNASDTWDLLRNTCKECLKQENIKNKDKRTEYNKKYWEITKDDQKEKCKKWREENSDYRKAYQQNWLENNIELKKQLDKEYRIKNWDKKKAYNREWQKKNYQDMKNNPERKEELFLLKIKKNTARRIREMLGTNKSQKAIEYVGIPIDQFKEHLEKQFLDGMTWDNYGEDVFKDKVKAWHIDHIIPCNAFDFSNPIHVKACFYYKNLRPLWAKDNIVKKDTYDKNEFNKYLKWYIDNISNNKLELIDNDSDSEFDSDFEFNESDFESDSDESNTDESNNDESEKEIKQEIKQELKEEIKEDDFIDTEDDYIDKDQIENKVIFERKVKKVKEFVPKPKPIKEDKPKEQKVRKPRDTTKENKKIDVKVENNNQNEDTINSTKFNKTEYNSEYKKNNKEKISEYNKKYREENKELVQSYYKVSEDAKQNNIKKRKEEFFNKCKKLVEDKGGIMISTVDDYDTAHSKLKIKCNNNHEFVCTSNNLNNDRWCPGCSVVRKNTTIANKNHEQLLEIIKEKKGELISGEYILAESLVTLKCDKGHTWSTSAGKIKNDSWCHTCAKIVDDDKRNAISIGITLYNQTEEGKQKKKESHEKRSITMALQREEIRKVLTEKQCTKCKETKNVSEFGKKSDTKDGYQPYCRDCIALAKKKSREKNNVI